MTKSTAAPAAEFPDDPFEGPIGSWVKHWAQTNQAMKQVIPTGSTDARQIAAAILVSSFISSRYR